MAVGEGYTKKELSLLGKEQVKLDRNLSGIRAMRKPPGLLIVVDPSNEHIAVAEAKKLGIPIMALVDTNCNPDPIDYVIPCNDDALKSVKLIVQSLAQCIIDKKNELNLSFDYESEKKEKTGSEKGRHSKVVEKMGRRVSNGSVTAQLVKELRDRTGIGMGKCKEALEEAGGNIELAIENLRKAGMALSCQKRGAGNERRNHQSF